MHIFSRELEAIPPFDFELTVHNPAGWYWHNPLEVYSKGKVWTALHLSSGKLVGLRLESKGGVDKPKVFMSVYSSQKLAIEEEKEIIELVVFGTGLNEDISKFYSAVKNDSVLKNIIPDLYGMRRGTTLTTHVFNSAILALTLQNAPIKRTNQMLELITRNYGQRLTFDKKTTYTWPKPQTIMKTGIEELTRKCKVGYRAKYLKSIAKTIHEGSCPTMKELRKMSFEEAKAEVMKLKGIGEYSAEIILPHGEAFAIDIWSAQIFWTLFFPKKRAPPSKLEAIRTVREEAKERWGKWRRLAFVYILCSLDNLEKKLDIQY